MREIWTERTFHFDIPPVRMPALLERLRGTAVRIEEKVRGVDPERLRRREARTWSAQEHAGHLIDLEDLHLRRLDELEAGAPTFSPADLSNKRTWEAEHNNAPIARILADFRRERGRLLARFEAWPFERLQMSALHTRLGVPLRVIDLAYFVAEHDDHHLARIHALL